MKKILLALVAFCALWTMTASGTEYVHVNSWYEEPYSTIVTDVSYYYSETYYVTISNGVDVDVTVELDAGWHSYYVTNNSTANIDIYVENYAEWGEIALSGVPNGWYTVDIWGAYGWTQSYVYY